MTRAVLSRAVDAGPGAFLSTVELRGVRSGGRFGGWEVLSFDPRYQGAGVEVGDVIVRVNGRSLERPDDLSALWQVLRDAPELVFEVKRGGAPAIVRVPVLE